MLNHEFSPKTGFEFFSSNHCCNFQNWWTENRGCKSFTKINYQSFNQKKHEVCSIMDFCRKSAWNSSKVTDVTSGCFILKLMNRNQLNAFLKDTLSDFLSHFDLSFALIYVKRDGKLIPYKPGLWVFFEKNFINCLFQIFFILEIGTECSFIATIIIYVFHFFSLLMK